MGGGRIQSHASPARRTSRSARCFLSTATAGAAAARRWSPSTCVGCGHIMRPTRAFSSAPSTTRRSSVPSSRVTRVRNVDVIVATSPQLFALMRPLSLASSRAARYVFELRDLWSESIRAVGTMKNERLLGALQALKLYRRAASIGANAIVDTLNERGTSRAEDSRHHPWRRPVPFRAQSAHALAGKLASRTSSSPVTLVRTIWRAGSARSSMHQDRRRSRARPATAPRKRSSSLGRKEPGLDNVLFLDPARSGGGLLVAARRLGHY